MQFDVRPRNFGDQAQDDLQTLFYFIYEVLNILDIGSVVASAAVVAQTGKESAKFADVVFFRHRPPFPHGKDTEDQCLEAD